MKTVNLFGFLSSFMLSTGIMFKIMHWPFAGIILFCGFLLLNLGFLPLFFFRKKKNKNIETS